jgi:hypothetical protein
VKLTFKRYSAAEDLFICAARKEGMSFAKIARALGRGSDEAIRTRYRVLTNRLRARKEQKIRQRAVKIRTCLHCGRPFKSWGPGNRICENCSEEVRNVSPFTPDVAPNAL